MSARFSTIRGDHIEYAFWLTFESDGGMCLTRGQPTLAPNERAMAVTAKLPRSLFRTPQLKAAITVADPGDAAMQIDVAAGEAALRQALGCDVQLIVGDPN